jgi:hypothetical protein
MKSPVKALRTAYYQKIVSLTYKDAGVRVIGKAMSDATASPYVQISTITNQQQAGKHGFNHLSTVLIQVVGYFLNNVDEVVVDDLAELVISNIISDGRVQLDLSPDFKMITSKQVSDNDLDDGDETRLYYRRLLRFEHNIQEL